VVKLPWAEPSSRLTALLERLVIDWLGAASQKAVGERLRTNLERDSRDHGAGCRTGLKAEAGGALPELGVDEKAFRKGHKYFTLVNDLKRSRVLYVAEDRTHARLDGFWETLTPAQRDSIQAVAMDMWDPYVRSVSEHLPEGRRKIVYDKECATLQPFLQNSGENGGLRPSARHITSGSIDAQARSGLTLSATSPCAADRVSRLV
jgi:transposase